MTVASTPERRSSWFDRVLLPGFAFKAVVIGGGYATGRELAEFLGPSGARGGLYAMALATLMWSVVAALTFRLAQITGALNYRRFFQCLLGPVWPAFEALLIALLILILAVFSAAAGEIGRALFGWSPLGGAACLVVGIALSVAFGNESVERVFKWVSVALYGTYAVFLILSLWRFGDRIAAALTEPSLGAPWVVPGLSYAGYNIVGAAIILPVVRHMQTPRDAIIGGALCGPLAMLPAMLFFLSMAAFPEALTHALPSDFLLKKLGVPAFHYAFQLMIFLALLESGTGSIHAVNERIAGLFTGRVRTFTPLMRMSSAVAVLTVAIAGAGEIGLVQLIASGYRFISYGVLLLYVAPLLTIGVWKICAPNRPKHSKGLV